MTKLIATSWDDGLESDKRLLDILDQAMVRASFALSPGRYIECSIPNDVRDVEKYGMLISSSDMQMYLGHDICNHTGTHREMNASDIQCNFEIWLGKIILEDVFEREVPGIVWPYGVFNDECMKYARSIGHTFGRTTPAANRHWQPGSYSNWNIVPTHWRTPIKTILESPHTHLALYGHTYELRNEDDWAHLTDLYYVLSDDSRCELVTLNELSKDISTHARNQFLRL